MAIQGRIGGRIGTRADRELVLNMTHALVIPCSGHALPAVTPRIKGCYKASNFAEVSKRRIHCTWTPYYTNAQKAVTVL